MQTKQQDGIFVLLRDFIYTLFVTEPCESTARAQKGSKGEVLGSFLSLFLDEYQEIALSQ